MMCFGVKERKRAKTNHCVIILLDDTQLVHELHASSTGQDLLDVVIKHLNLLETSYFGLKYLVAPSEQSSNHNSALSGSSAAKSNNNNKEQQRQHQLANRSNYSNYSAQTASGGSLESNWLDVSKSAIKQLKDVRPMTVYFGVKYYASDPCKLAEEITRYQFFLQCKQDILHSRLPVSFELAAELFALAVQSELGDYDPQRHLEGYVSEFQFLPNQSLELERRVSAFHRQLTGQVPATAELNFLERVKWLDLYGCELHPIQYDEANDEEYALGLNPSGVLVLRNKLKVAQYLWPRIIKTKTQGRCFLMDVIDNTNSSHSRASNQAERNRFGFRLIDKFASRKLRWSIEDHKSFYHLIHNSASLNQLAHARQQQQQQQQHPKSSNRFRNSIRSAINVNLFASMQQQQAAAAAAAAASAIQHQQQQKLRSSMKSLSKQAAMMEQQQQYAAAMEHASRQQPSVVRMPSRRYSNRSLTRPSVSAHNEIGIPPMAHHHLAPPTASHTMSESQRQQALMLMSQFNQMNQQMGGQLLAGSGKSQTLKPVSSNHKMDSKEAKKNPYYHMMMMMAAAASANQQQQQQQLMQPEVSILPPGRHIVQPAIYKATSVVNGINQMGLSKQMPDSLPPPTSAMMQFFNTPRPHYPTNLSGHESPRSTKSAIAPSSALKMASKKLAKQQQQMMYAAAAAQQHAQNNNNGSNTEAQPLLPYDMNQLHLQQQQQYSLGPDYYAPPYPNSSPRSLRSARMAARHKSKSTNENLHLLHRQQQLVKQGPLLLPPPLISTLNESNKQQQMLLATTHMLQQQMPPPPPNYHNSRQQRPLPLCSDNESDNHSRLSKQTPLPLPPPLLNSKKRATFAGAHSDGDDDYCCSRSDCSSVDQASSMVINQQQRRRRTSANQAPPCDFQEQRSRTKLLEEQQGWQAIRQRHNDFSSGKGGFVINGQQVNNSSRLNLLAEDQNNNNIHTQQQQQQQVLKSSGSNTKQATPILLSLNYEQTNANNKAVQLLNHQRQQLNNNSQSSEQAPNKSNLSVGDCSTQSSVASSPQTNVSTQPVATNHTNAHAAESTASSSTTTSGYYAGTNSTGSVDSGDTSPNHELRSSGALKRATRGGATYAAGSGFNKSWQQQQQEEQSSRAKIAIGSYANRISNGRLLIGQPQAVAAVANGMSSEQQQQQQQSGKIARTTKQQEQFYLGESNNENSEVESQQSNATNHQWSPLNQIQQHAPSSLKYVSFDV